MIYLDHNATTPLDPLVLERMLPWLRDEHGNASSVHAAGQRARQAIDDAREQLAGALGCAPKELVFTSGGTEADNLALRGLWANRRRTHRRIVVSQVEHPAVLETARALAQDGAELVEVPVTPDGRVDLGRLAEALTPDTALASIMWANNETGVVNPIDDVASLCRARGVPLHVDAVQAAGRVAIDLARIPIDLLTLSAHKLHGPKGAGALFVRRGLTPWTVQTGGHQERGRRGGTESVASLVGFGEAMRLAQARRDDDAPRIARLSRTLEEGLRALPGVRVAGDGAPRLENTICACFAGVEGEALLMALDLAGICASSGSACTAGSLEPSHVLLAMGIPPAEARGALRLSLGRTNTQEEVDAVLAALARLLPELRRAA